MLTELHVRSSATPATFESLLPHLVGKPRRQSWEESIPRERGASLGYETVRIGAPVCKTRSFVPGEPATAAVREALREHERYFPIYVAAAAQNHPQAVKKLIALGASVDARDDDGKTPLDWAKSLGNHDVIKWLAKDDA